MPSSFSTALVAAAAVALGACSSAGAGPSNGGHGLPNGSLDAFAPYCAGTLLVEKNLMEPDGAAAWVGDGSLKAPAGTSILVAASFDKWDGYVVFTDATPAEVAADFQTGLIPGKDFTAVCATDDKLSAGQDVLVSDSTFFPAETLTGTPCTLPAGEALTSFNFVNTGKVATVSSDQIKTECGLDTSYSNDIHYAGLIAK